MKRRQVFWFGLGLLAACAILFVGILTPALARGQAGAAASQADTYDLTWYTIDGGSSPVTSANAVYSLNATVGQADGGEVTNVYTLSGGFWPGVEPLQAIFLPFLRK